MDNLWLKKNVMKYEGSEWATADASKFTTIFGMCILVSFLFNFVALSQSYSEFSHRVAINLFQSEFSHNF